MPEFVRLTLLEAFTVEFNNAVNTRNPDQLIGTGMYWLGVFYPHDNGGNRLRFMMRLASVANSIQQRNACCCKSCWAERLRWVVYVMGTIFNETDNPRYFANFDRFNLLAGAA